MNDLKPCPFCGELPYIEKKPLWKTYNDGTTHGYYGCFEYDIRCHKCGCNVPLGGNDTVYRTDEEAKKNATEAWNRRAEVVHGRWEYGICTMCGYPIPTDSKCDFIDEDDCLFCYHCGAKMNGGNENG